MAMKKSGMKHELGHRLKKLKKLTGQIGKSHFQSSIKGDFKGQHIFYSALAGVLIASQAENAQASGTTVELNAIYTNEYPGESIAHALTFSYWTDSGFRHLDWINPLELIAIGGDAGRWIDRQISKELIGITATVSHCSKPRYTFSFDANGNLIGVGKWNKDGQLESMELEQVSEPFWDKLNDEMINILEGYQ